MRSSGWKRRASTSEEQRREEERAHHRYVRGRGVHTLLIAKPAPRQQRPSLLQASGRDACAVAATSGGRRSEVRNLGGELISTHRASVPASLPAPRASTTTERHTFQHHYDSVTPYIASQLWPSLPKHYSIEQPRVPAARNHEDPSHSIGIAYTCFMGSLMRAALLSSSMTRLIRATRTTFGEPGRGKGGLLSSRRRTPDALFGCAGTCVRHVMVMSSMM